MKILLGDFKEKKYESRIVRKNEIISLSREILI